MPDGEGGEEQPGGPEATEDHPSGDPRPVRGAHAASPETLQSAGRSTGGVWIPPSPPAHAPREAGDAPEDRAASLARARAELLAKGLAGSPKRSSSSRRLLVITATILLALVALLAASFAVLGNLGHLVTTTTATAPLTSTTLPATTTTSTPTTISPGISSIEAFQLASVDERLLDQVGGGGQSMPLVRTTSRSWITTPAPTFSPVVVYLWSGSDCAACVAGNLVVVSSLEAIGGTFHGLAALATSSPQPSIDLHAATYVGPVRFESSELYGASGAPEQSPTVQADGQFNRFDRPPFTAGRSSLPFLDVGGHFVMIGVSFPTALVSGLTLRALDADLASPSSPVARAVLGDANLVTASICKSLHQLDRPLPPVCLTPVLQGLVLTLPATAPSAG